MKIFSKKRKLHDGYFIKDGEIHFYRGSALGKALSNEVLKVDEENIVEYEGMCKTYRDNFMKIGWLRLHTPIDVHQEYLGTHFLSVPEEHRARIAEILEGGTLVTFDTLKTFRVLESGKGITLEELLGGGEIFDLIETGKQNREKLDGGAITKEEWERQVRIISEWEKTKFHIECFQMEGMFVQRKKN